MAKITANQITAACYAAWNEPDAKSAAKRIGHLLLEEVLSQETAFAASSERKATEAESAMHELDQYVPTEADDDADLFTKGAA